MVANSSNMNMDRGEAAVQVQVQEVPCIGLPLDDDTTSTSTSTTLPVHGKPNSTISNGTSASGVLQQQQQQDEASLSQEGASTTTTTTTTHTNALLEDRVQELEEKLSTLSLLIQRQRQHSRSISPPSMNNINMNITPPASPPMSQYHQRLLSMSDGVTPVLESPAPVSRPSLSDDQNSPSGVRHRRNLSFRVLHAEDSPHHNINSRDTSDEILDASSDALYLPPTLPVHRGACTEDPIATTPYRQQQHHYSSLAKTTQALSPILSPESTTTTNNNDQSSTSSSSPPSTSKDKKENENKGKWLAYLNSFQESNYDTDKQMEEFVKVPSAVEALLNFGFWICVDSFLYILTILPIRFVWSLLLLLRFLVIQLVHGKVPEGPFRFHRRHSYQLIQVSIIYTIYKYVLMQISIGKFYHWIRGQAMVKLYVLIAMVEVFDRLMCSLGQDCLDSLYWNTTHRPRSSRLIVSVLVVLAYTMVHSFLLFIHVATLNVAMNSDDQALISLLIGGNFAEIKSTVFKKYNKANLFKITASDICERFKLALFLALVLTLNMSQGMDEKMVMNYINMCGVVWCAEWLADWIKHSFITKFNYISSGIYPEYGLLLAGDVTGIGHEGVNLDHSHAVVKRIGFAQLPLVCVMARYLSEAFKYATYESQPSNFMVCVGVFAFWSVLLVCKLSLGSFLQRISHSKLKAAPEFSMKNASVAKKKN